MLCATMNEYEKRLPLTEQEAEVAGLIKGEAVYGDSTAEPNEDDHADAERADGGEHF
jgi:hypothetical protein